MAWRGSEGGLGFDTALARLLTPRPVALARLLTPRLAALARLLTPRPVALARPSHLVADDAQPTDSVGEERRAAFQERGCAFLVIGMFQCLGEQRPGLIGLGADPGFRERHSDLHAAH